MRLLKCEGLYESTVMILSILFQIFTTTSHLHKNITNLNLFQFFLYTLNFSEHGH